jgi:hypothetical protein
MSDAVPTPIGQKPVPTQSNIIIPKPYTEWDALKEAGWWINYDWAVLITLATLWITAGFWFLFSTVTPESTPRIAIFTVILLISVSIKLFWLITLVLRCSKFVLKAHAEIATMPEASARIAVAYMSGKK